MGIAGIWEHTQDGPNGLPLLSFSMLTINADGHPLMQLFHRPTDEKRMLVILGPDQYDEWLHCPVEEASGFLTRYPAEQLTAHPAPRSSSKSRQESQRELSGDYRRPTNAGKDEDFDRNK